MVLGNTNNINTTQINRLDENSDEPSNKPHKSRELVHCSMTRIEIWSLKHDSLSKLSFQPPGINFPREAQQCDPVIIWGNPLVTLGTTTLFWQSTGRSPSVSWRMRNIYCRNQQHLTSLLTLYSTHGHVIWRGKDQCPDLSPSGSS